MLAPFGPPTIKSLATALLTCNLQYVVFYSYEYTSTFTYTVI